MVRNGEYVSFGEFIAFCDEDEQIWRVSRVTDHTHNSFKITTIGEFTTKADALSAMKRNGMHLVHSTQS